MNNVIETIEPTLEDIERMKMLDKVSEYIHTAFLNLDWDFPRHKLSEKLTCTTISIDKKQ